MHAVVSLRVCGRPPAAAGTDVDDEFTGHQAESADEALDDPGVSENVLAELASSIACGPRVSIGHAPSPSSSWT
jgi:hypothetical protein